MAHFCDLVDLAAARVGGVVLAANDEFFAPKENLLKLEPAVFLPHEYTDRGKWMDGWETRRKRGPGYDWCIVRLGLPGVIHGVDVDTAFFKGNYPDQCSIDAAAGGAAGGADEAISDKAWVEILPRTPLLGDTRNLFAIHDRQRWTHLRLNIYPDGGVARLRVHGEVQPDPSKLAGELDLAAVENGGTVLVSSDMFFGSHRNLLMPGRAKNMSDGWETKRRRGPGHDWVIIKLGVRGAIQKIEVDTAHFKGNFPDRCALEACDAAGASIEDLTERVAWSNVLPQTKLQADHRHHFDVAAPVATHVRFRIYPDGGVSRLRLIGRSA
jgi:allantoicase